MRRQELNVFRMRLLGAEVRGVSSGSRTLKDAINEAMRDWVTNVAHALPARLASLGPHPYPTDGARLPARHRRRGPRADSREREGRLPDASSPASAAAPTPSESSTTSSSDKSVKLIGIEAGGRGKNLGEHAARLATSYKGGGESGVLQGTFSYVLQDLTGQIAATHSVSAGLDYPAIGPEHAMLSDAKRAEYTAASDDEALAACSLLARTEGIIPALESSHAIAECIKRAPKMKKSDIVLVNVSGRGDKDIGILREKLKF